MDEALQTVTIDQAALRVARMKRSLLTTTRLMDDLPSQVPGRPDRWAMITATYAPSEDWEPRHISDMLRQGRMFARDHEFLFRYLWVLELTRAGRPHYHMALKLPAGVRLPKPDDAGWWPYGMTRIEYARHPVAYMAKYLSKMDRVDHYPRGARIRGLGSAKVRPGAAGRGGRPVPRGGWRMVGSGQRRGAAVSLSADHALQVEGRVAGPVGRPGAPAGMG